MPDVLGSFQRGYNLGSSIINDMDRRERQKTLQEREDTQWQQSQEDRTQRLADMQTSRERDETTWQQQQEDREQSLKDAKENRSRTKTLQGREDVQWKQSQDQYNHQQKLLRRTEAEGILQAGLNKMTLTGEFDPEWVEQMSPYLDENPQLDVINIFAPKSYLGRQQAKTVMKDLAMGRVPSSDDPMLVNSIDTLFPEIIHNQSLPTEYNGKKISKREISNVFPTQDGSGFYVHQRLTLDDGSTVDVPVTEGRTSDPDDPPLAVPFQVATSRLSSMDQLDLSFSDENKQSLFDLRVMNGLAKKNVKDNAGIQKQLLESLDKINQSEIEALNVANDESEKAVIKQQYSLLRQRTESAYAKVLSGGRPSGGTQSDPKMFQSAMTTFNNGLKSSGITLTADERAGATKLIKEGIPVENVLADLATQKKSGTGGDPDKAASIVDSFKSNANGEMSKEQMAKVQELESTATDNSLPRTQRMAAINEADIPDKEKEKLKQMVLNAPQNDGLGAWADTDVSSLQGGQTKNIPRTF